MGQEGLQTSRGVGGKGDRRKGITVCHQVPGRKMLLGGGGRRLWQSLECQTLWGGEGHWTLRIESRLPISASDTEFREQR